MFGLFNKKKHIEPFHKGHFTSFGIEEIYDFIGAKRINKRIEELKNVPTMGTSFNEFVNNQIEWSSQGLLSVLGTIIENYFPNDLDIILFIYEFSKKYTESSYYTFPKSKMMWEEHLRIMDMMIKRTPENESHWRNEMIPKYWIDLHYFYFSLIQTIRKNDRKIKINKLKIEGKYSLRKSVLTKEDISFEIKERKSPNTGKYLSLKSSPKISRVWFDLTPYEVDQSSYFFKTDNCSYKIQLFENECEVKEIEKHICIIIDNPQFNNLEPIVYEILDYYISNFDSISKRVKIDFENNILTNGFLWECTQFLKKDTIKINQIIELVNKYPSVWGNL